MPAAQSHRVAGEGDEARVGAARDAMADLQRRLRDAGIDVDDRLKNFPERLARLRERPDDPDKGPAD